MKVYIATKHDECGDVTIRGVFSTEAFAREFLNDDPAAINVCRVPPYDPNKVLAMEVDQKRLDVAVDKLYQAAIGKEGDWMEIKTIEKMNEYHKISHPFICINYDRCLEMRIIVSAGSFDAARKNVIKIRDDLVASGKWVYEE